MVAAELLNGLAHNTLFPTHHHSHLLAIYLKQTNLLTASISGVL